MSSRTIPYGQRLLTTVLDETAQARPGKVYAIIPKTNKLEDGFEDLTFGQVANAVNKLAWFLVGRLGIVQDESDFPTIAYIGPNDVRYALVILAAIKVHRKTLVPLPYNSAEAQLNILKITDCTTLMAPASHRHLWNDCAAQRPQSKFLEMPNLHDLIKSEMVPHFLYDKSFEESKDDPMLVIHTSGTTGLPKPLIRSHLACSEVDKGAQVSRSGPIDTQLPIPTLSGDSRMIMPLPLSWGAGIFMTLAYPIFVGTIPILLPTSAPQPMTGAYIDAVHTALHGIADGGMYVPDTLRQVAANPTFVSHMRYLDYAFFVGAPLDDASGDTLSAVTRVQSGIGSTDVGIYTVLLNPDPKDWNLVRLHPTYGGFKLVPFTDDGLYELVLHEKDDMGNEYPAFRAEENKGKGLSVFRTMDLFKQVEGRKGYWRGCGRADDFVKLKTLTKFNATQIESAINKSALIKASVVGGDDRDTPFMILEPEERVREECQRDEKRFVDVVWPHLQAVNEHITEEARLKKELVIETKADRPITKTAKGTCERRKMIKVYEREIEALYAEANGCTNGHK